jgi:lipoprotein-anchoring transpeptidase ErfK/SrfK
MKLGFRSLSLLSCLLLVAPPLDAAPATSRTVKPSQGPFAALFAPKSAQSNTARTPIRRSRSPLFSNNRSNQNTSYSRAQPRGVVNYALLNASNPHSNSVVVDIGKQRAYLLNSSGTILINTPISSARPDKYTPRGAFSISERVRSGKISTIYGVAMPFWMRLSGTVFGMHAGYLPGYPASAGCVRLPSDMAQLIYEHTSYGTRVNIYSSWVRS